MDIFDWAPDSAQPNVQPNVKRVRFGDGYEQRQPAGLNHQRRTYSLTFSDRHDIIKDIDDFLTAHAGVTAFQWFAPDTYRMITVICPQWGGPVTGAWREFNCTFEQVVA